MDTASASSPDDGLVSARVQGRAGPRDEAVSPAGASAQDHPIILAAVDDVPVLLEGIRAVLETRITIADYACAATVDDLIATRIEPDVVLLDIRLNDGSAPHENVARILGTLGSPVLMFSQEAHPSVVQACLTAGAAGMLEKNADADTLAEAIMTVSGGEPWLSPEWARVIADEGWLMPHLADREKQALTLFAAGLKTSTIARKMGVKEDTVGTWLKRIRIKYMDAGRPAPTRTDLYIRAVEDGYCEGPQRH